MRNHAQDRPRGHAFAGTGFANDAQGFTLPQLKVDAIHRFDHPGPRKEMGLKVLYL
jgi:hypothetical protein